MEEWAKKGHRVIGMCIKELDSKPANLSSATSDMMFLGLVAQHDPPRPESAAAIARARAAGVEVVMITGDNEQTAEAIATQIGLLRPGEDIVTGEQLLDYSDQDLLKILPKTRIFARTTPQLKSRIVSLYQQMGEIVIVTGDGVNDAIALKQADVGIAMGKNGTDVARETADIVLADDNFATIVVALELGRSIVRNLKNTLVYLLTGNASEASLYNLVREGGMKCQVHRVLLWPYLYCSP
jgi:Ca2+-transporting ATPase